MLLIFRLFKILLVISVVWQVPLTAAQPNACLSEVLSKITEEYRGRSYDIIVPEGKKTLDVTALFGEQDQVFLGVTKGGHYYLQVGKTRVEGAYFPLPSFKSQGRNSEGYLVHFPNIPAETISKWQEAMTEKSALRGISFSCVHTACSAIRTGFGIKVAGTEGPNIFSGSTFRKLLEKGFIDDSGKAVEVQIYKTSPKVPNLHSLSGKLDGQDVSYGVISAIYMLMTGGGVYILGSWALDTIHE